MENSQTTRRLSHRDPHQSLSGPAMGKWGYDRPRTKPGRRVLAPGMEDSDVRFPERESQL